MKAEHIQKAEQEARAACEGLGHTEEQIAAFVEEHIANEARRETEKLRELSAPKRNKALTDAIINVAVSPWRNRVSLNPDEIFPAFRATSRGYDAEDEESARLDSRDRTRECNRG